MSGLLFIYSRTGLGAYNKRMYISTAIIISAAITITGSIISVPTSTARPRPQAQTPSTTRRSFRPAMIHKQGKHNDQHSDDDESCHGYFTVQYSQTVMLNSSRKVTGSIIMPRSIIVVEIPGSTQQSLSGPRVPAVGLTVSF